MRMIAAGRVSLRRNRTGRTPFQEERELNLQAIVAMELVELSLA